MSIWQYLLPDNSTAAVVLYALLALSIFWGAIFVYWMIHLGRWSKEIDDGQKINKLTEFLDRLHGRAPTAPLPPADVPVAANEAFNEFCVETGLRPESPVARHVRAIFDAGWKNSRLDVGELLRHTTGAMFKPQGLLRSVLAIFIVVGLLGTLLGLAGSLSELSRFSPSEAGQSSGELAQGLANLLQQLKSAFAPSIWGIAATLLFVLLLAVYVHFRTLPIKYKLEQVTITIWVSHLFPSTSHQFLERLHRSEQHMEQSSAAVGKISELSRSIHLEARRFRENLQSANEPLSALAGTADKLNTFTDKFKGGVDGLTSFQKELQTLYQQIRSESKEFHDNLKTIVKESAEFQQGVQQMLRSQGEHIKSLMMTMKSYEQAYLDGRGEMDARLREVLAEAKKAYSASVGNNRALIQEIGDPLRGDLRTGLGQVETELREKLGAIDQKLGALEPPVARAAGSLQKSAEAMGEQTKAVTNAVSELNRSVAALAERLKQSQNHNNDGGGGNGVQASMLYELAEMLMQVNRANQLLAEQVETLKVELDSLKNTAPVA